MTGLKTNERPGVRAQHRHAGMAATKARVVLDLIRGRSVAEARTVLQFCDRGAADPIAKVLDSAVANAANNNDIPPEELYVATAYADEGPTLKRWRPRARGRATRIRKRTCHITIIVGRYSGAELDRLRTRQADTGRRAPDAAATRARRVARSRARQSGVVAEEQADVSTVDENIADENIADENIADENIADENIADEPSTDVTPAEPADEPDNETVEKDEN